ncbi:hypothetical protein CXB77_01740 [Chromatium okenii]|uniref:Uncharacterized protein n=1 Tax=Chromatium okenii TaxID=61644 RepID=A0A2S7XUM3_9GAMM|nr:hypothetical protein CXB77_01740 [Chromatium okenii]
MNEIMPLPNDAALAMWLRERLALPGLVQLGVDSTADQGAVVSERGEIELWRRWRFEARIVAECSGWASMRTNARSWF